MSELYEMIYREVCRIPEGYVATYAQVAERVGNRRLARVVGNALHVNPYPGIVPCHRVVNSQGCLSGAFAFGSFDEQKKRLESEGVEVVNFKVDLKEYGVREWL